MGAHSATKLVAALTDISAAAIAVEAACKPKEDPGYEEIEYHHKGFRRLANVTQGPHSHQPLSDLERIHLAKFDMTEEDLAADPMKFIRLMMSAKPSSGAASQKRSDSVIV